MKVGIDARLYGPTHTGIGRYVKNLIDHLLLVDKKTNYVLFGDPNLLSDYLNNPRVKIVRYTPRVYTLTEQVLGPIIFSKEKLDLLHIPHLNAPLGYKGKMIITIHDLIKHYSTGPQTTTLPAWQYFLKHQAYKLVVSQSVNKATSILTPTHYWKKELIETYKLPPDKITVTYEAVDHNLERPKKIDSQVLGKYQLSKPFIVYTGNLYPHKNVDTLVKAVSLFNQTHRLKITLALIFGRSVFTNRFPATANLRPLGFVSDQDMSQLYSQALCLVQPSFIEGFGLTGLEAMAVGLPVISSSASCLPEVYQDAALYFDPYSYKDLSDKLEQLATKKALRENLIKEGYNQVNLFSWKKTAQETFKVYRNTVDVY